MPIRQRFKQLLVTKGLLNVTTGNKLVYGIEGEEYLLNKWEELAQTFHYEGKRVAVTMLVEQLPHNDSRCTPIIQVM